MKYHKQVYNVIVTLHSSFQISNNMPVRHTVLFEASDDKTEEELRAPFKLLRQFQSVKSIPGILHVSYGAQMSYEGLGKGFNFGFSVLFDSIESRDIYLTHPDHDTVKDMLLALLKNGKESLMVMDWIESDED